MNTACRARGLTLVEVLAAMVLLGIVLPVAMHGISLATSVSDAARHKAEAAVLAQSKLSELVATRSWQTSERHGDFGEDHPDYEWSVELSNWDRSTLQQLDVHVLWTSRGQEQAVTVSTLVDTESY